MMTGSSPRTLSPREAKGSGVPELELRLVGCVLDRRGVQDHETSGLLLNEDEALEAAGLSE